MRYAPGSLLVIALLCAGAVPLSAQDTVKTYRVAILSAALPRSAPLYQGFEARLRELGYVEGRNLAVMYRNADGRAERMPALAAEIVRFEPDVIVTPGPEATLRAARDATRTIPIIFAAADYDPLALGYVESLARPGGNMTGVSMRRVELTAKRLELLKEIVPNITRVAVIHDVFSGEQLKAAEAAAVPLALQIEPIALRDLSDFAGIFAVARRSGAGAVLAGLSPVIFVERGQIAAAAIEHRLPTIFGLREATVAGGLISYGPNLVAHYRRAADYVHKVLGGAHPADLAVEQPTLFELVLSLKTAATLALSIPPAILARADEVIE